MTIDINNGGITMADKLAARPFHPLNRNLSRDLERKVIALRLASPKRAETGSMVGQHIKGDCPLFDAVDQDRLL